MTMWTVALATMAMGVTFLFFLLSRALDEEHTPLKLLFLILTIWMLPLGIGLADTIADDNGASSDTIETLTSYLKVTTWTATFATFWFLVYYGIKIFSYLYAYREKKNEVKV
tara:strand:+ start:699 stop:1034 length:336 start_codon:yes stop_codon:yes gene_type:complete